MKAASETSQNTKHAHTAHDTDGVHAFPGTQRHTHRHQHGGVFHRHRHTHAGAKEKPID